MILSGVEKKVGCQRELVLLSLDAVHRIKAHHGTCHFSSGTILEDPNRNFTFCKNGKVTMQTRLLFL